MKTHQILLAMVIISSVCANAQIDLVQSAKATAAGRGEATVYSETSRGPNHKVWERIEYEPTYDGKLAAHRHSYQELATGMHYRERDQWLESEEKIEILPNNAGAVASKGPHKVIFPSEIKAGIIELQTPEGQWLRSRVWGLAYFDASSGESILLAEVQESEGQLVGDNIVRYPNAFTDILADIRYTYTRAGFEQDVVLREQPPAPAAFGLNPQTTRLQVLTEFVEAPRPIENAQQLGDLADKTLGFGVMSIGPGKAFSIDAAGAAAGHVPVVKDWQPIDGRPFLIEEVRYEDVSIQLRELPPAPKYEGASLLRRGQGKTVLAGLRKIMPKKYAKLAPGKTLKRMVKAAPDSSPSFVMDYVTLSSQADFTFKGDTTHYISGTVNLTGTTTIEGGSVIKFANSTSAKISTPAPVCNTDAYRMSCFTSMHDNSIGEAISGSSGSPAPTVATYLEIAGAGSAALKYLRFAYASNSIAHTSFSGDLNPIWHSQFFKCGAAVQAAPSSGTGSVELRNCLLAQCGIGLRNTSSTYAQHLRGENLTLDQVTNLITTAAANGSSLYLTNCLLTAGGGISPVQGSTNLENSVWLAGSAGVFQIVGGGNYYLTNSSTNRNVGGTNINADLLTELRNKTTYPPIAYTNTTFTAPATFNPQAQRDSDTPDLGYHYDPLDYIFGGCHANSNLTFTAGTAVGWFRTSSGYTHAGQGLHLGDKQIGTFSGTASAPCYWARLTTVQENDRTAGYGTGGITGWAANLANASTLQARFTRFSMMAGDGNHMRDDNGWFIARVQDSEFYNGGAGGYVISMYFTNCLISRMYLAQVDGNGPCGVVLRNCTMIGNLLQLVPSSSYASTYKIWDCAFDQTTFQFSGPAASSTYAKYDYNAYTNATRPFPSGVSGPNDVVASGGFNWQGGALGNYYLPSSSGLIDVGSVTAPNIGLYHYTTQTNGVNYKEGTSLVDIGYHYVEVDMSGVPLDEDLDGTPDYLEDADGDGVVGSGETDWAYGAGAADNGLRVMITEPKRNANLP